MSLPEWLRPWAAFRSAEAGPEDSLRFAAPGAAVDTTLSTGSPSPNRREASPEIDRPGPVVLQLSSFERGFRAFLAARAAVGLLLLGSEAAKQVFVDGRLDWVLVVCLLYAALTAATWWRSHLPEGRPDPPCLQRGPWLLTIGVDLLTFGVLHLLLASRAGMSFVPLLVLPVLMAGVMTPRLAALAVAASVSLLLLGQAGVQVLAGGEAMLLLTQSGLIGSGFFVIALLASELAGRLAREETAARGSMELARQQAQLNRLVIEEMQDGVLVADRQGRVRVANPAARRLMLPEGDLHGKALHLNAMAAWLPLLEAVQQAFAGAAWPEMGREISLQFDGGRARSLWVRMRFTRRSASQSFEELCVMFLQDLRDVQARLRQEKLAAMGRVSAGIAHEIRNPLAAIAQANALLAEDAVSPSQHQLTRMVADNVERLKRIVDDVMEVAAGPHTPAGAVDVRALVEAVCREWAETAGVTIGPAGLLHTLLPAEPIGVVFDADHLRRVLVNLLDNACRHGSHSPGSIEVRLCPQGEGRAELCIASDGPPIPPDVEAHLFEPFFSTRSRGTGLGLYICKEVCGRYDVSIDYRLRDSEHRTRNEFFLTMRCQALRTTSLFRSHSSP